MSDVLIANASSEAFLNSFSGYIPHHFMSTGAFNQWFQTEITRLNFIQRTKATSPAGKKKPPGGFNSVGEDDASTTLFGPRRRSDVKPASRFTCKHGPSCDAWQFFPRSPSALSRLIQPQGCPLLFLSTLTTRDLGRKQVVCLPCC